MTTQTKDLSPQGAGIAEDAEITAFSAPHPHQTTPATAQDDDEEEQTYAPVTQYDLTALLMELERTLSRGAGDARCILMTIRYSGFPVPGAGRRQFERRDHRQILW